MHLAARGHYVSGIDNFSRRRNVASIGSISAIPVQKMKSRISMFKALYDKQIVFYEGDILNYHFLKDVICKTYPDCIVHLGEQPSAAFSMIDRQHAIYTQHNNIEGTLNVLYAIKELVPRCHLLKLGTMGEYGTPNIDIPEGFFEIEYRGRKDILPFPRRPNSIYHLSKAHDSANVLFASEIWDLAATDIMQGVVYGSRTDEMIHDSLRTRFDFDEAFGTVLNRFCVEAVIGQPLTVYGNGKQKRGFIDLADSIKCLTIAVENPPENGLYRVFNQLDEVYDIIQLAEYVVMIGRQFGLNVEVSPIPNPRKEKEKHYYKVENEKLKKLGFQRTRTIEESLRIILQDLLEQKAVLLKMRNVIPPKTIWANATYWGPEHVKEMKYKIPG